MDIVFFGAGVSREFGIPTTGEMVFEFRDSLRPVISDDYTDKALCDHIFSRLGEYPDFDIETLVTVLEHIIDPSKTMQHVLTHPTLRYFPVMGASWNLITKAIVEQSNREKESANRVLGKVKDFIIDKCGVVLLRSDERFEKTYLPRPMQIAVLSTVLSEEVTYKATKLHPGYSLENLNIPAYYNCLHLIGKGNTLEGD